MFGRLLALCGALWLAIVPSVGHAARVSPMIVELEPQGRGAVARIELTNDSARGIPYEVQMMRGEISPEGELTLTPADEEFLVFPAQALVESKSQQVFRVQYVGESALGKSEIYYMSIRQIPVEFEPGVSQVQVVVNYNVLTNVVPDGATPEPTIRSADYVTRTVTRTVEAENGDPIATEQQVSGIQVDVGNDGNRYFHAGLSDWKITGTKADGQPFEQAYSGEDLSKIIGVGVVAPGKNRIFLIPSEEPLADGSIAVQIDP